MNIVRKECKFKLKDCLDFSIVLEYIKYMGILYGFCTGAFIERAYERNSPKALEFPYDKA